MAVGFRSAALTMRITRSSMLEILRQDYIRTARAKGACRTIGQLSPRAEEAVLPVITVNRHRGGVPDRRTDRHRDSFQTFPASPGSWSRRCAGATIRSCRIL